MPLLPGARLGVYEVVAAIGEGGMGEVYRAGDARLQRDVAIKVLPETLATDEARLSRFEQEALATAALNHPTILVVFDIGGEGPGSVPKPASARASYDATRDGQRFIVSEIPGHTAATNAPFTIFVNWRK